jgi:hypothetical protein
VRSYLGMSLLVRAKESVEIGRASTLASGRRGTKLASSITYTQIK